MTSTRRDAAAASVGTRDAVVGRGITWMAWWGLRWLVVAALAVVVVLLVGKCWSVLLPTVLALIVTTLLEPLSRLLHERLHLPRALAALVTLVAVLAGLGLVLLLIAPSVAGQVDNIARSASGGLQQIRDWLRSNDIVSRDQIDTALRAVQGRLRSSARGIASGVLVGVGAVASAAVTALVTLVLTFFFLKDGHRFVPWATRVVGPTAGAHVGEALRRSWDVLGGFIRAQALVGAADGVLIGTGLLVLGVPAAVPLAILTFFGGFVPIIGAVVAGALAVLVALVSNGLAGALTVLVIILVVQQIEGNILQPILQSKAMRLHPAVILLAVTLGSALFGIVGAFLAVPCAAVGATVLRYVDEVVGRSTASPNTDEPVHQEGEQE